MFKEVTFNHVKIKDKFWAPRISTTQNTTLPACLQKCEESGRIQNFVSAATGKGEFVGIFFNDSDLYKVLEGVAYSLMHNRDPKLEAYADEIIDKIAAAQQEDGYLVTYYIMGMGERWTDMERHEMYCGGHLIEAAVAYYQATGKGKLLTVARRVADHFDDTFGPGKRHWVAGHQEIELALVKLYKATGEERYLKLAHFLLEERGHGHGVGGFWGDNPMFKEGPAYCQDDKPVSEQERVTGHAVRAMYMYTGMADVAAETGNKDYLSAMEKLWRNVVLQNMYITGGIGSTKDNEGFTDANYFMPNDTAYCETCASAGLVFWNDRLNKLWEHAKYADILERALYNGALAGVSLAGDEFFYVNPLASDGTHRRQKWYDTACCPTQIARFMPAVGSYVYRLSTDGLFVNMFVESDSEIAPDFHISQKTSYPWDGAVEITLTKVPDGLKHVNIRMPDWCKNFNCKLNGKPPIEIVYKNGYAVVAANFNDGDVILYEMDMPTEKMKADPRIEANQGRIAIQRGPLVYCAEAVDNPNFTDWFISDDAKIVTHYNPSLLGGVVVLDVHNPSGEMVRMIPYYAWANRTAGKMEVWLPERREREGLYQ